jgi:hypothetical protein
VFYWIGFKLILNQSFIIDPSSPSVVDEGTVADDVDYEILSKNIANI